MKKNRILSSLLCLSLAAGLLIPGLPAYAEGEGESGSSSGMKLSKTAKANGDGTYTITLEAYATGQKVISQVDKDVPTDIVLVLDQSGSMSQNMNTYDFREYTNKSNRDYYDLRHNNNGNNGNLYYKLKDGSYATVSVTRTQGESTNNYTQCPSDWKNYTSSNRDDDYWKYSNNLYVKVGDEYQKVTLTSQYKRLGFGDWDYVYTYTFPDESTFVSERSATSPGDFGGKGPLYYPTETAGEYTYTYTCTDAEGNTINIGTSTGANTVPTGFTLYERYVTGTMTRLAALQSAVTTFADSVATKAKGADGVLGTEDDIDHRIAVVGFATGNYSNNSDYPTYENTELFIGSNQYNYSVNASSYYNQAFQDMSTQAGYDNVIASKNALAARGATYTNYGLMMANGILTNNPVPEGEKRNRVIIVFTDGVPGYSSYDSDVASSAITEANTSRNSGANVYAVGIFEGADATSAGNQNGNDTQKANWFMQNLSDNKGTPRTPSYYLSAADAGTLNSIFKQISDNIESGGTTTTLNQSAVIKDIISPAFALPAEATASHITLETYKCTGKSGNAYIWDKNTDAMGATAAVNGDQVSVTGFDFADNYVGTVTENGNTTYRGNKLVISFTVSPKDGFLGGNNVYTNTSAGVYENDKADTPVLEFNRPQVNVPIDPVTVTAVDKDVYLLSDVKLDALKNGATVKVGDVSLDLSKENYGLESWQNEYVDITVEITDANGTEVTTPLSELKDDTTYTITVTVTPKSNGEGASGTVATEKSGNDKADINVYKPELTYKDSEVFYGDPVPTDFNTNNRTDTKWKHGNDVATADMGTAPALSVTYTPEASKISDGKINSTQDIQVAATVKIGSEDVTTYTIFVHTPCDPACGWNETVTPNGNPAFLLHVKTASLTIYKRGDVTANEGFIFKVTCPDGSIITVSAPGGGEVTITGLPSGTYAVTEDTDWSWRYKNGVSIPNSSVTLTKDSPKASVTVTNTKTNEYLLDGNDYKQNNSVPSAAAN
ncbi:MAG: hypothetical protein ACI3VD_03235 [Candidatus Limivicinus sp.]